jgi:DnaJ-class molecular chaperone
MGVPSTMVDCATCKGEGSIKPRSFCPACDGRGKVQVAEPVTICPRCKGTGDTADKSGLYPTGKFCPICGGIGWALIL